MPKTHRLRSDEGWVLVLGTPVLGSERDETRHATLVVARPRSLEGSVVDEAGEPVPLAELVYASAVDLRRQGDAVLDFAVPGTWGGRADPEGGFALARVPELARARLEVRAFGFLPAEVPVERFGDQHLRIVLQRAGSADGGVRGRVTDGSGLPIEGARVGAGERCRLTDAEGLFQLEAGEATGTRLWAVAPGSLPGTWERAEGEPWPAFVELVLGGPPLAIRGRVLDQDGAPVEGAELRLTDATTMGLSPIEGTVGKVFLEQTVEDALAGRALFDEHTKTDGEGRFVQGGLLPRAYELFVADPRTLACARFGPVQAGATVEIVVRRSGPSGPLAGRVVDQRGEPLAGVMVRTERRHPEDRFQGDVRETDQDGRFAFGEVAYEGLALGFFGGPLRHFENRVIGSRDDPAALEVVIVARGHLNVDLGERRDLATAFRLLGGDGEPVAVTSSEGSVSIDMQEGVLAGGRSEVYSVPAGAYTLVLLRGGAEVERAPVHVAPGELCTARF